MTTYPMEFHRRLEQKWGSRIEQILTVTGTAPPPRDPNDDDDDEVERRGGRAARRAGGRPRTRRRRSAFPCGAPTTTGRCLRLAKQCRTTSPPICSLTGAGLAVLPY